MSQDEDTPIAAIFGDLIETAKSNELAAFEKRLEADRVAAKSLRQASKILNTSELFLSDGSEEEDYKKKKSILSTMDQIEKDSVASAKAKEKGNEPESDTFPDPPIV